MTLSRYVRLTTSLTGGSVLGMASPELSESFTMPNCLDAERCHQDQACHHSQCGRSEAAKGEAGDPTERWRRAFPMPCGDYDGCRAIAS